MTVSEKIKDIRARFGLSQEQFGEKLRVSRQTVAKWESGAALPDSINIMTMAKLFGVTADYLLQNSDPAPLLALHQNLDEPINTASAKSTMDAVRKAFPEPYTITPLVKQFRASRLQEALNTLWTFFTPIEFPPDIFTAGQSMSDWSAYFLVENNHRQMIVNLQKNKLVASEISQPFTGNVYKTDEAIYRKIQSKRNI